MTELTELTEPTELTGRPDLGAPIGPDDLPSASGTHRPDGEPGSTTALADPDEATLRIAHLDRKSVV